MSSRSVRGVSLRRRPGQPVQQRQGQDLQVAQFVPVGQLLPLPARDSPPQVKVNQARVRQGHPASLDPVPHPPDRDFGG